MPGLLLPQNATVAFHSIVRRFFTQSAQQPSNRVEHGVFFLFNVLHEVLNTRRTYDQYDMTPEQWAWLQDTLHMLDTSELAVLGEFAVQIFSFDYSIVERTITVRYPSETQTRFVCFLNNTLEEQLRMAMHRQPGYEHRIASYNPRDDFPLRHIANGVDSHWTTDGHWIFSVRTPSIVVYDHTQRQMGRPFYPLIIEVGDAGMHADEEALARDYLLGDDERPSLFLCITLWDEADAECRVGTYSLWRSEVQPDVQPQAIHGFWPPGTVWEPRRVVQDRAFTARGGHVDVGDGEIDLRFSELSARCEEWTKTEPEGTRDWLWLMDGIQISFERLSHIWQLARDGEEYVESREFLVWEEEEWAEGYGEPVMGGE
ncbi:uncharacterized protein BKCO1_640008 [Diplodia corticola]|uniref:Uncharacterized protein n=1 Tax=Diplodia corticola TaxID=236234 RepID=A0A1J9RRT1_9PEZI|nr:uncharacterized protein BKCO1_640008 [Diplodia corticola]OJD30237.1 hypothetical protein BKCO1_640008 [Diplodia corticola]